LLTQYGYDKVKRSYPEVREYLVSVGHGSREVLGDQVWTERLRQSILSSSSPIVITDVRYQNEVEFLKSLGSNVLIWRITRPGVGVNNETERSVDGVIADLTIENNGTIEDLSFIVDTMLAT
jgi:hypothetical protein